MVSIELRVKNPSGLHLRPAGILAKLAMSFPCDVVIISNEKRINAKNVLGLMTAAIKCGTDIVLQCSGENEQAALDVISTEINNGLGELAAGEG